MKEMKDDNLKEFDGIDPGITEIKSYMHKNKLSGLWIEYVERDNPYCVLEITNNRTHLKYQYKMLKSKRDKVSYKHFLDLIIKIKEKLDDKEWEALENE